MVCMLPSVSAVSPVGKREALLLEEERRRKRRRRMMMMMPPAKMLPPRCWSDSRIGLSSSQGRLSEVVVVQQRGLAAVSVSGL